MKALVKVVLVSTDPALLEAWRAVFADRPEVEIVESELTEQRSDAWVSETKRGDLKPAVVAALGDGVEVATITLIKKRYGGSLPADFAVWVPTGRQHPKHLVVSSNTPRNPHGINDSMRVALAAGAALQAVHMQNALEAASIKEIALPALGPVGVSPRTRAELMWTAYELFRQAELPDFAATRHALADLLGDALMRDPEPGALKRSFRKRDMVKTAKSTVPDRPSGRAPLKPPPED